MARRNRFSSALISVVSFLRVLPLFFSARPKTPLRVLCIVAFDTLHVLRNSKRLPAAKLRTLAVLLDFGACANAICDNKEVSWREFRTGRQLLENAGIGSSVVEFLRRLRQLETRRPFPGGDHRQFQEVASYREAIVRLFLGMIATTAIGNQCLDDGIRATYREDDLVFVFRIVMECQIIDDVLDYAKDMSAELPSFLTSLESLPQAFELTQQLALRYADDRDLARTGNVFPLRSALFAVAACAKLAILLGRWRRKLQFVPPLPESIYGRRLLFADASKKTPSSTTF